MKRVAGIMRVRNEGNFIHDCVESCIDALDELIVVYNDCTDNSAEEIKKVAAKYPATTHTPMKSRLLIYPGRNFRRLRNCRKTIRIYSVVTVISPCRK